MVWIDSPRWNLPECLQQEEQNYIPRALFQIYCDSTKGQGPHGTGSIVAECVE